MNFSGHLFFFRDKSPQWQIQGGLRGLNPHQIFAFNIPLSAKRSTYWENQDEKLDLSVEFSVCLHICHWRIPLTDETPKCNCILNKDQDLKALAKENKSLGPHPSQAHKILNVWKRKLKKEVCPWTTMLFWLNESKKTRPQLIAGTEETRERLRAEGVLQVLGVELNGEFPPYIFFSFMYFFGL